MDFSLTRDNIVKAAFQKIGIVGEGLAPSSDQYTEGSLLLNAIVKSWNASLGMPLWAMKVGYILPVSGTSSVSLGPSGGHATLAYVSTTLNAAHIATDTALTVASITGISASDNLGIELDNGEIDWTTVNGAPSGTTVTATTGLTTAASSGNRVYTYTTKLARPLRIIKAFTRVQSDTTDTPVEMITSNSYLELSSKTTESWPTQMWYDPQLAQGVASFWPRFVDGKRIIVIHFHRPLEDFDATGDNPDFPQEYYLPLIYELAVNLAPQYAVPMGQWKILAAEAKKWLDMVGNNDYEEGSIQFVPGLGNYYGGR